MVMLATAVALTLVLNVPWLSQAFLFDALRWPQLFIALGMAALALCWLELVKVLLHRRD
jgi:hypothetical protein